MPDLVAKASTAVWFYLKLAEIKLPKAYKKIPLLFDDVMWANLTICADS